MSINPIKLIDWIEHVEAQPDPPWLIKDFIQPDAAVLVSGPPTRSNKTWFAMACSLALASGRKIGGLEPVPPQTPVLFLEQEGPRKSIADRFRKFERSYDVSLKNLPIFFAHREPFYLEEPGDIREVSATIEANGIKFVVIDTLSKSMRGDENSSQQVNFAMKHGVDQIRKKHPGTAVMYLHHIGKPRFNPSGERPDIDDEVRGSSALNGFYDIHHAFRRNDNEQEYLDFTVRGNQIPEKYYTIEWFIESQSVRFDLVEKESKYDVSEKLKDKCIEKLQADVGYTQTNLFRAWGIKVPARGREILNILLKENALVQKKKQYFLS